MISAYRTVLAVEAGAGLNVGERAEARAQLGVGLTTYGSVVHDRALHREAAELLRAASELHPQVGLGRIVAVYYCSTTSHQIYEENRYLFV
jgi:hypothetical protein